MAKSSVSCCLALHLSYAFGTGSAIKSQLRTFSVGVGLLASSLYDRAIHYASIGHELRDKMVSNLWLIPLDTAKPTKSHAKPGDFCGVRG